VILTLDLGTTVTKAALWDRDGMVGLAETGIATDHPAPGWAEQDPLQWWASTVAACGRLARETPGGLEGVTTIGCTGARQSFGLFDVDAGPLGPGILWSDRRDVDDSGGGPPRWPDGVDGASGLPPDVGSVPAKLAWTAHHRPADWARTAWVLAPRDLVVWRLTGRPVTDPTLASCTGLYDADGRIAGPHQHLAGRLPEVVASGGVTGELGRAAADALGLGSGLPVVVGAGDRACEVLGTGATPTGPMVSWGTTANVSVPTEDLPAGPGRLAVTRAADGGWLLEGGLSGAGSLLAWLGAVCGRSPAELAALAAVCPPGARGVTAAPWMDGARAPWWRPHADAAFVGLSGVHGPGELARAVFEAVARDVVRCLVAAGECRPSVPPPVALHLAGAGASSPVWQEVLSGISGLPVDRRRSGQAASAGAALLASGAVGDRWELDRLDPVVERSAPDPVVVEQYDRLRDGADHVAATLVELGSPGPVGPTGPTS